MAIYTIAMNELKRPNMRDYMKNKTSEDDEEWYEQFCSDMEIYLQQEKIQKFEIALKSDYGIDDETWNNTPDRIKKIMVDMHDEAEKHHYIMEELEIWRDNMPI